MGRPRLRSTGCGAICTLRGRLYRIIRLRQLGFPLSQVADVLAEPEWQLASAIEGHLAEARQRAAAASRLCTRLAAMAAELARQQHPSPQEMFSTVEEMIMMGGTDIRRMKRHGSDPI